MEGVDTGRREGTRCQMRASDQSRVHVEGECGADLRVWFVSVPAGTNLCSYWRPGLCQRSEPTLSPVSTGMGDRVRVRLPEAALYFGM